MKIDPLTKCSLISLHSIPSNWHGFLQRIGAYGPKRCKITRFLATNWSIWSKTLRSDTVSCNELEHMVQNVAKWHGFLQRIGAYGPKRCKVTRFFARKMYRDCDCTNVQSEYKFINVHSWKICKFTWLFLLCDGKMSSDFRGFRPQVPLLLPICTDRLP
jgi:hypothetical protein